MHILQHLVIALFSQYSGEIALSEVLEFLPQLQLVTGGLHLLSLGRCQEGTFDGNFMYLLFPSLFK